MTPDRQIKDRGDDERTRIRREGAVPQLQSLHERASTMQHETMPSGKLGEALDYLTTQWPKLVRYVEDPRWRSIRTSPKMRSVHLLSEDEIGFLQTPSKALRPKASAALCSIVSTARTNGLEPYAYLRRLFAELPKAKSVEDFEAMPPFNTAPI